MNTSIGVCRFSGLLFMTGLLFAYRPLAEAQANKAAPKISYIAVASNGFVGSYRRQAGGSRL